MILGLQVVGVFFALVMIYLALLNYKRGELNGAEILSWLIVWVFVIFVTVFPELLRTFATTFAVSRLFDLMVVGAFIVVIGMVSSAYVRTKRLEKRLEELVRKLSMEEKEKQAKKAKK